MGAADAVRLALVSLALAQLSRALGNPIQNPMGGSVWLMPGFALLCMLVLLADGVAASSVAGIDKGVTGARACVAGDGGCC